MSYVLSGPIWLGLLPQHPCWLTRAQYRLPLQQLLHCPAALTQTLLAFLGQTVREGFVGEWQMDLLQVGSTAADLLPRLAQAARPGVPASLDQI